MPMCQAGVHMRHSEQVSPLSVRIKRYSDER